MRNYVLGTMAVACLLISIRLSVLSAQEKDSVAAHPIPEEALLASACLKNGFGAESSAEVNPYGRRRIYRKV